MRYALALIVCAGCSASPAQSLVAALPARAELHVDVPAAADVADGGATNTAQLYLVTHQTSTQLNGTVDSVLELIGKITSQPPTHAGPDVAEWGPFTPSLSPATYRLLVHRVAPDQVQYHLDGRPRDASDDAAFQPIISGLSNDGSDARAGQFAVDVNLAHALDPAANPGTGALQASYQLAAATAVRMQLGDGDTAAAYRYDRGPDGSGDFRFATHANITGDPANLEDGIVRSRWLPSGAGRGDAHVRNGDAGAGMDLSECWDKSFARTFVTNGKDAGGDPASCVFPDAVFADL